jgi:Uma2 family endonuclease
MMTAVATQPKSATAGAPALQAHRFTVRQYHRMIETGILTANDRVELLEGWIVDKMPHNPPHDGTVGRINRRLLRLLPDEWLLRVQSAITLGDSEPEPDLTVVRGPEETYFTRHPRPRDIGVLIEVADSTLLTDRRKKGSLYARFRIPIYWIVNINDECIEVYTQPIGGKSSRYRLRADYPSDQTAPLILGGAEVARIPVHDLLPPPTTK